MGTVVGPGGLDGIPREQFRFQWWQTMQWSDGQERILEPGVDYPSWMDFATLSRRLKLNASRQQGHAQLWLDDEGHVHLIMTRDQY